LRIIYGFKEASLLLKRKGAIADYLIPTALKNKLNEIFGIDDLERVITQIIEEVKKRGDDALFEYTLKIDGVKIENLEVGKHKIEQALKNVDSRLMVALKQSADRIYKFHEKQHEGVLAGVERMGFSTMIRPIENVGIYCPGGTATYPSTVLMTAIPAKIAGVNQLSMVTPPGKDGEVPVATLAAASIARVDRVFCIGGAQAIAALAYGTKTISKVDKICGPGNIFVMLAKRAVYGMVDIDGLQGPSEVIIIADKMASPANCAAEILAQAEHDPLASTILITDSFDLANKINKEVNEQKKLLERNDIIEGALKTRGKIVVVSNIEQAIELSNMYAPEHLCIDIKGAEVYIDKIKNAGCVFIGDEPTAVIGDYVAGPSHALPTTGTARFSSPLNITSFLKYINIVNVDKTSLRELGQTAITIARAEGLEAHARAIEKRLN
jgi:histidinol dehydrogenase